MWLPGSLVTLLHGHNGKGSGPVQIEAPQPAAAPPLPEVEAPEDTAEPRTGEDPTVPVAFAAGWQMTELYHCAIRISNCGADRGGIPAPKGDGLACLREL